VIPGVCPGCGLRADLEVFAAQAGANAALRAALALPPALGERVIRYLRLFSPPQKVLSQAKAARLLAELAAAVDSAQVSRRNVAHAAPLPLWTAALDAVLAQPPERLPLDGHGYLFAVAWNLAEKAAARREQRQEDQLRHGDRPPAQPMPPDPIGAWASGERESPVSEAPVAGTGGLTPAARPDRADLPTRREAGIRHARELMGLIRPWKKPPAMADSATPTPIPTPTPTSEDFPCSD
jgi:hypothetical protein